MGNVPWRRSTPMSQSPRLARASSQHGRRRHHRRRSGRLIHQGSALRFASISEADEGLFRCVGTSSSSSFIDSASVDEGGRGELDDPGSLMLDQPDADNVTIVSATDDTEQQSGVVTSPSTDGYGGDGGDDPRIVTTSTPSFTPVYGSFIYLRVQGKSIQDPSPAFPKLSSGNFTKEQVKLELMVHFLFVLYFCCFFFP
jgi:hypothetical protein